MIINLCLFLGKVLAVTVCLCGSYLNGFLFFWAPKRLVITANGGLLLFHFGFDFLTLGYFKDVTKSNSSFLKVPKHCCIALEKIYTYKLFL